MKKTKTSLYPEKGLVRTVCCPSEDPNSVPEAQVQSPVPRGKMVEGANRLLLAVV